MGWLEVLLVVVGGLFLLSVLVAVSITTTIGALLPAYPAQLLPLQMVGFAEEGYWCQVKYRYRLTDGSTYSSYSPETHNIESESEAFPIFTVPIPAGLKLLLERRANFGFWVPVTPVYTSPDTFVDRTNSCL